MENTNTDRLNNPTEQAQNKGFKPLISPSNTINKDKQGKGNTRANIELERKIEYIKTCSELIKQSPEVIEFLKARGIEEKTIKAFNLGYDPKEDSLIIPYDNINYSNSIKGDYINQKGLENSIYNIKTLEGQKQPVFILDSELDVILMEQLGAKAIGSIGINSKIDKFIKMTKEEIIKIPLIIWVNGKLKENNLKEELEKAKYPYFIIDEKNKRFTDDYLLDPEGTLRILNKYKQLADDELNRELREENAKYYLDEMLENIKANANQEVIKTGFNILDNILGGGLYAGLYLIGAISGLGKTSFCLQLADNIAKENKDIIYFSLEMSKEELIGKSISRLTKQLNKDKTNWKCLNGILQGNRYKTYSECEIGAIKGAIRHYRDNISGNIYISEGVGECGTDQIKDRVNKHIELTGRKPVVIIDYLQLLKNPLNNSMSEKQVVDKNVLSLKKLARENNIPVIVISSFNRDNYTKKLSTSAFKESGGIEYSSDVVLGLGSLFVETGKRDENGKLTARPPIKTPEEKKQIDLKDEIVLKVLKNRRGYYGTTIKYDFYPAVNDLEEISCINEQGNIIK